MAELKDINNLDVTNHTVWSESGEFGIVWEYSGEGYSGDYNDRDPNDARLLRFYCYRRTDKPGEGGWEEIDSASYCTLMRVNDTTPAMLDKISARIIAALESGDGYKRELQYISWASPEDYGFLRIGIIPGLKIYKRAAVNINGYHLDMYDTNAGLFVTNEFENWACDSSIIEFVENPYELPEGRTQLFIGWATEM